MFHQIAVSSSSVYTVCSAFYALIFCLSNEKLFISLNSSQDKENHLGYVYMTSTLSAGRRKLHQLFDHFNSCPVPTAVCEPESPKSRFQRTGGSIDSNYRVHALVSCGHSICFGKSPDSQPLSLSFKIFLHCHLLSDIFINI